MKHLLCLLLVVGAAMPLVAAYDTGRQPLKAAALSLAVPGGGQVYNSEFIKAALILGIEGWFLGSAIYHNAKMNDAYDNAQNATGDDFAHWESEYNRHYNSRQSDYWWLGTTVFLSVIDAFVDAHLYNYKSEKQRLRLKFNPEGVALSWQF
ncbi:MAG: hypothetical protein K8R90_10555 [Candidatus Cloacimonetes bacterium]|nr:hypothetical protein [Candidatus Cloacimonadota bacterium]